MALKVLVFGTEDTIADLKSSYEDIAKLYDFEIISYAAFENKKNNLVADSTVDAADVDFVILHSHRLYFHSRFKFIEALGFPRNRIIDGRAFQIPDLDFPRLLEEGVAYGVLKNSFSANSRTIYPQVYKSKNGKITLSLGKKSYIRAGGEFEGDGKITLGNFCSFAKNIFFSLGQNGTHNYRNVSTTSRLNSNYSHGHLSWSVPAEFSTWKGYCEIRIGNDVWIGRGCNLKCTNPNKPLIIGDGAVIASDSVVVKNVPPYAIAGGNPAKIIKFRFSEDVIESLLRIKWWDWDIDKIHDNFKYFNDIEKFISLHDK